MHRIRVTSEAHLSICSSSQVAVSYLASSNIETIRVHDIWFHCRKHHRSRCPGIIEAVFVFYLRIFSLFMFYLFDVYNEECMVILLRFRPSFSVIFISFVLYIILVHGQIFNNNLKN